MSWRAMHVMHHLQRNEVQSNEVQSNEVSTDKVWLRHGVTQQLLT